MARRKVERETELVRRAVFTVPLKLLCQVLHLPEDTEIVALDVCVPGEEAGITVEHSSLPLVAVDDPSVADPEFRRGFNGKLEFVRWNPR